jgi:protein phosphatase
MKLPHGFAVGTATHTGWVRANNEDDFLVGALPHKTGPGTLLCAIADGMGGAAGGAEASRIAVRALGTAVLDGESSAPLANRFQRGFDTASQRVFAESENVPALRDMGTTMTALCFEHGHVQLGHVGDTRAYRCRDGQCEPLTEDHAAREPHNLLLRCIGGGRDHTEVDRATFPVLAGERYLLLSDGVWSTVADDRIGRLTARGDAQAVAEALVSAALAAGGPDNATAIVVDVVDPAANGVHDVDLPRDERPSGRELWPRAVSLRAPVWPWVLWVVSAVLIGSAVVRWLWDVDVWAWVVGLAG